MTRQHEHKHAYFATILVTGTLRIVDGMSVMNVPLAAGNSYRRPAGITHDVMKGTPYPIAFVEMRSSSPDHSPRGRARTMA